MLDFPSAPTVGLKFPVTPVPGIPVYTWDGEKWTTVGGSVGGKLPVWSDGSQAMSGQLPLVAPPVNPTDAAAKSYVDARVRHDAAQGLTTAQQVQARANVYAAPFDAAAFGGLQINGAMDVIQRFAAGAGRVLVNGNPSYITDQFLCQYQHASAVMLAQQHTAMGNALPGVPNGLYFGSSAAGGNFGATASDIARIETPIEGWRVSRLALGTANAQPFTIGFAVFAKVPGKLSVAVTNSDTGRSYVGNVTVNAADTLEWKTITIPGDTGGGNWYTDNRMGMLISISSLCGSNWQMAAGAWGAGLKFCTADTTNFFAAANQYLIISAFGVWPGNEAPTLARVPFIQRPYDYELLLCKRHYWSTKEDFASIFHLLGGNTGTTQPLIFAQYPVEMRVPPTLTPVNVTHFNALNMTGGSLPLASIAFTGNVGRKSGLLSATISGTVTQGWVTSLFATNVDAELQFSASM
jgi:hypothetical protein